MTNNAAESQLYIVGGLSTKPNAYPWQVSLQAFGLWACGGSIISDMYILTAAHCFEEVTKPSSWRVVAGKHSSLKIETFQRTHKPAQIIVHKDYDQTSSENDIALIKLTTRIQLSDVIQPVCLPSKDIGDLVGVIGTITGWGDLTDGGSAPDYLQETEVPIITNADCQTKYPEETVFPTQLCAGYKEGGRDSCQGDSGGPMVILQDGKYVQVGITSYGYGCAEADKPGFYTRVSSYLDWISLNMAHPPKAWH